MKVLALGRLAAERCGARLGRAISTLPEFSRGEILFGRGWIGLAAYRRIVLNVEDIL